MEFRSIATGLTVGLLCTGSVFAQALPEVSVLIKRFSGSTCDQL